MHIPRSYVASPIRFLKEIPLFAGLSEVSLSVLGHASRRLQLPKGIFLFFQEDPADSVYAIISGSVVIVLSSEDGRELVINEMRPGDVFGEIGLITGKPRTTSALTKEASELIVIPGTAFLDILWNEAPLAKRLLILLAERLGVSSERESALAFLDAPARVCRVLFLLEKQSVNKGYVTISQEELARRTGLTRQTVARFLGDWRRNGWLLTGRGRIMLLDHVALEGVICNE
jgi:CRP/FNR family cyclic AMP-dependent transcriptional regulator